MRLGRLASLSGARVLTNEEKAERIDIEWIFAGDTISDLITQSRQGTLLVTNLGGALLPRVAALVDAPGICFVNGRSVEPGSLGEASSRGTVVLVSERDLFETCGLFYRHLVDPRDGSP